MKVYTDTRWPDKTGIGIVKAEILERAPKYMDVMPLPIRARIGSPWSTFSIAAALRRAQPERGGVFYSPGFVPSASNPIPSIVTVHDLLHLHFYSKWHVLYYNLVFKPLYRKCAAVICDSEFSRNEFLEWSGYPADRCFTVYLGVSPTFSLKGTDTGSTFAFPYVLYPGNRRSYKNIRRLMEAYSRSSLPDKGVRLVLTGAQDLNTQRVAADIGITENLVFAGFVNEPALVRIYRNASAIAFVSLYEGFGLPIIEGMAVGVPVLTSNTSSMAEIAADAALVIDPYSIESITSGLETAVFDSSRRAQLIAKGLVHAAQFSWDTCAAKVWAIIETVGSNSSNPPHLS